MLRITSGLVSWFLSDSLRRCRLGFERSGCPGSADQPVHLALPGFCTDDRNPLAIYEEGHLDHLVRRAIALGAPLAAVYRTASWSAARGFGLVDRGLVAPGYLADFLLLGALENCAIHSVIRPGRRAGTSTPRLQSAEGGVSCPNPFVM